MSLGDIPGQQKICVMLFKHCMSLLVGCDDDNFAGGYYDNTDEQCIDEVVNSHDPTIAQISMLYSQHHF